MEFLNSLLQGLELATVGFDDQLPFFVVFDVTFPGVGGLDGKPGDAGGEFFLDEAAGDGLGFLGGGGGDENDESVRHDGVCESWIRVFERIGGEMRIQWLLSAILSGVCR